MRIALVSDVHVVGGADDPAEAAIVSWLDARNEDIVCILGDLFHAWWGFPQWTPPPLVPTCAALERLCQRGIPLVFVPGNHDFVPGPFFSQTLRATVVPQHIVAWDGVSFLLAHGDEADTSLGYRLTRQVLRGRVFSRLMDHLGPERGMALLHRLAGASRDHGHAPGPAIARQRNWVQAQMRDGVKVVITGHLHQPGIETVGNGIWVRLGGFGGDRMWCLIEDGVPELREHR